MSYTLEVCVDSTASALAAKRGGASRLELCADLIIGGTTPSLALLQQVKAETGLPVRVLLRPRFGDFCYDHYELAQMEQCAAQLVAAGADGIVTGVLTADGALDADALRPLYAAARQAAQQAHRPVDCTLHRAFDLCRDPFAALDTAHDGTELNILNLQRHTQFLCNRLRDLYINSLILVTLHIFIRWKCGIGCHHQCIVFLCLVAATAYHQTHGKHSH